jgi:hypothetical protein
MAATLLLTVLDSAGHVVEERQLLPRNSSEFVLASFSQCVPWNGGVAAIGLGTRSGGAPGWILELDAAGAPVAEQVDRSSGSRGANARDVSCYCDLQVFWT